jgi:hypothetical protein
MLLSFHGRANAGSNGVSSPTLLMKPPLKGRIFLTIHQNRLLINDGLNEITIKEKEA